MNWRKYDFVEKTFADCSLVLPMNATPPNFAKKLFTNSHKTLINLQKFSPSKVSRYMVYELKVYKHCCTILHIIVFVLQTSVCFHQ